jgi:hypothetical protein
LTARNKAVIAFSTTITINETEIRALDALVGYGFDSFIGVFKDKLGAAYIRDHESGLKSFFETVGHDVLPALNDIDTARRDLENAIEARHKARMAKP